MNNRTQSIYVCLALVAALLGCAKAPAATTADQIFASSAVLKELSETRPAFSALQADEKAAVHAWLFANCAVGADTRRTQFVRIGSRAELALIEAFRMGPPVAFLTELADSRRSGFAAIREQLAGEDRDLFEAALKSRINAISENSYVTEGINQIILSYRLSALDGLASVGTKTSIGWLERTPSNLEIPELQRAAKRTLDALRERSKIPKS